jgi:branched-chain amino acid aminotransferase
MSVTWFDGNVLKGTSTDFNVRDRGLMLGDGIFETLLVFNRVALWRNEHVERMEKAAKTCGIIFRQTEINAAVDQVLAELDERGHVLRVSLTRGITARGLARNPDVPTLILSCDPTDLSLAGTPVTLMTSTLRRNPDSFSDRHKSLSYINNVQAAREASGKGFGDALMLNVGGYVACSTVANIFMVNDGLLITPRTDDGILNGIMRQFLVSEAVPQVEQRVVQVDELYTADAVFLTNSLQLVRPVSVLDNNVLKQAPVSRYLTQILNHARRQCGAQLMENPA